MTLTKALPRLHRNEWRIGLAALLASILLAPSAGAQRIVEGAAPVRAAKEKPDDAEALKDLLKGSSAKEIETFDGVYLALHYWSPKDAGKDTPAVVLMHERGRNQRDWFPTAKQLADEGFAVVTFDFRGHGESNNVNPELYRTPREVLETARQKAIRNRTGLRVPVPRDPDLRPDNPRRGSADRIDHNEAFRNGTEFALFAIKDIEAIKRFLIEENNSGRLNVRRLGIVTVGVSVPVTLKWAEDLEFSKGGKTGWTRQGADLSALVCVSPTWNHKGFKLSTGLSRGELGLPILLLSSSDGQDAGDAARFARSFRLPERASKEAGGRGKAAPAVAFKSGESAWVKFDSKLSDAALVKAKELGLDRYIVAFLSANLSQSRGYAWERRRTDIDTEDFGSSRTQ